MVGNLKQQKPWRNPRASALKRSRGTRRGSANPGSQGPPWEPTNPRLLPRPARRLHAKRRGSSTIDYFLLVAIVLPLAAFLFRVAPRAMHSVYDLLTVVVAWPFL
jgi:hypothetical protein